MGECAYTGRRILGRSGRIVPRGREFFQRLAVDECGDAFFGSDFVGAFERAAELRPEAADFQWDLALARLHLGDFERGWPAYESRWRLARSAPRPFPWPQWDGSALDGRRILLHLEQGFGDAILAGRIRRAMVIGKGSLFLGRMTNLFDGLSFVVEENGGGPVAEEPRLDKEEVRRMVAEALREVAGRLAQEDV